MCHCDSPQGLSGLPHPEISQRFRVMVIGNNGQECAAAIEHAPRIERKALMFEQQRLGDLFWKFTHPRNAIITERVERDCSTDALISALSVCRPSSLIGVERGHICQSR